MLSTFGQWFVCSILSIVVGLVGFFFRRDHQPPISGPEPWLHEMPTVNPDIYAPRAGADRWTEQDEYELRRWIRKNR